MAFYFSTNKDREGEKRKIAKRRRNLYIYRWLILMLFFCSGGQICSKVIVQHNLLVQVCSFPIMIKSVFLFVSNLIFHHTSNVVDNDFGVHYFSYNPSPTSLISFPSHLHTLFLLARRQTIFILFQQPYYHYTIIGKDVYK